MTSSSPLKRLPPASISSSSPGRRRAAGQGECWGRQVGRGVRLRLPIMLSLREGDLRRRASFAEIAPDKASAFHFAETLPTDSRV
jgi:hypothetical protein